MSFSSDARAEIMRTSPDDRTELRVELTAAYILAGTLTYRGKGRYQVSVSSEHAAATRYFYALTRRFESLVRPQLQTVSSAQLGGKTRYRFELDEDETLIMLSSLELLDDGAFMGVRREPDPAVFASERLTLCWLRGAFLACGWVSDPEKSYNL
ncbi:MAG: hypothetical protein IJJ23_08290, partial [Clostridia bacterium]|nr:hypothetical protein [Clostridia bacterium]